MLQSIRDRATGWIAWVIVILISIPFALWGIQEYLNPDPTLPVATVNGSEVSVQQFQRAYQQQRQRLQGMLGASFDMSQLDEERLKQQTLERIVNEEVLIQTGLRVGLRVSDQQLAQAIHVQSVFQQDGAFSKGLYEQWLRQQGLSPGGFEFEFRRALLNEQLVSAIVGAELVTRHDVQSALGLVQQRRSFSQLLVPSARFSDSVPSDQEIADYYENNKGELLTEERVRLQYVELSRDALGKDISISEEELQRRFRDQQANFAVPEQRRASHILITVAADADDDAVEAARAKAAELKAQIDGGTDFATVARENSEDPGSASAGGDLGLFGRNVMDKSFEDAVFSMQVDEVSDPVRSAFGFHVIKLTEVQAPEAKPFEAVRDDLLRSAQQEAGEKLYFERAELLAQVAFEQSDSLEPAADALGLEVQETAMIGRTPVGQAGITSDATVLNVAFSPEVLEERRNSEPLELEGGRVVVIRVTEHEPARQRSLDETRDEIAAILKERNAREKAEEAGKALIARLRAGESADEVAASMDLSWDANADVARGAGQIDPSVLSAAFRMPRPESEEAPVFDGVAASNGGFAVLMLTAVSDGDAGEDAAASQDTTRDALAREYGQSTYQALVSAMRKTADVSLREENL